MSEKLLYEELTPAEFLARLKAAPIAYLPMGTLEWHGAHLPLGADGIQSREFFLRLAERVGGILLPMLFVGPDRHEMVDGQELFGMDLCRQEYGVYPDQQLPGSAYWIKADLFARLLRQILCLLKRAGFRIVVAHGHGPSVQLFGANIDKWEDELGLKLFHCWTEEPANPLGIQTDHAAANETSIMMAVRPDLVRMENLSFKDNFPFAVHGKDPRVYASPELGKKAIDMQEDRMARLLRDALAGDES